MPYGETQPDGSVNVYDDNGQLLRNEPWWVNQGLPAPGGGGGGGMFPSLPQFPSQNVAPTDLLGNQISLLHEKYLQARLDQLEIPEMQNRSENDKHNLAMNYALNLGQQMGYTVDPGQFSQYLGVQGFGGSAQSGAGSGAAGGGGGGAAGGQGGTGGGTSIAQARQEVVDASGGNWAPGTYGPGTPGQSSEWATASDQAIANEYFKMTGQQVAGFTGVSDPLARFTPEEQGALQHIFNTRPDIAAHFATNPEVTGAQGGSRYMVTDPREMQATWGIWNAPEVQQAGGITQYAQSLGWNGQAAPGTTGGMGGTAPSGGAAGGAGGMGMAGAPGAMGGPGLYGRPTFEREQWAANLQANPRTLVEGLLALGMSPQQAVSTLQQSPLYNQLMQPWFSQPGMTGWNPQQGSQQPAGMPGDVPGVPSSGGFTPNPGGGGSWPLPAGMPGVGRTEMPVGPDGVTPLLSPAMGDPNMVGGPQMTQDPATGDWGYWMNGFAGPTFQKVYSNDEYQASIAARGGGANRSMTPPQISQPGPGESGFLGSGSPNQAFNQNMAQSIQPAAVGGMSGMPTGPSGFQFIQGRNLPVRQTLQDIQGNSSRIPLYSSLASYSGQNPDMFWGDFTSALPKGSTTQGTSLR